MPSARAFALALPFALIATGSAQTVLLRFKPPVGATSHFVMSTSMTQTVPGMPAPMSTSTSVPMTMRVVSRSGDVTTMESKMGQAKVTIPAGSPMASMKPMLEKTMSGVATTTTIDQFGSMKGNSAAAGGASGMMGGGMNGQTISFPKKAVKVGESWSETLDMGKAMLGAAAQSGMTATGKIPIVYRLVSLKKVGGKSLATISVSMKGKSTMNMPQGKMDMNLTATGVMVVDAATGMFVSTSMTSDTAMQIMGKDMHQHMVMSMK